MINFTLYTSVHGIVRASSLYSVESLASDSVSLVSSLRALEGCMMAATLMPWAAAALVKASFDVSISHFIQSAVPNMTLARGLI